MKIALITSLAAIIVLPGVVGAEALKGHELASQSKLTLTAARAIALKARPGKIVDQELEKEGGGSGLRYSFDVMSHGKTIEVGVDANTGEVLENGAESLRTKAKEAVMERKTPKP